MAINEDQDVVLYDSVDRRKLRDMEGVCVKSCSGCVLIAAGLLTFGLIYPLMAANVTRWTAWACMAFEGAAVWVFCLSRRIKTILNKTWRS